MYAHPVLLAGTKGAPVRRAFASSIRRRGRWGGGKIVKAEMDEGRWWGMAVKDPERYM